MQLNQNPSPYKPQEQSTHERRRHSLLGKVHIAKKALGLDDDTYRDMLEARYGKRSSAKLRTNQLVDLVEYFKAQGFKAKKKAPARAGGYRLVDHSEARKMRALWISLYHLGVVRDPSEKALTAFAKRLTGGKDAGLDSLAWINAGNALKVIEALKKMGTREAGVDWSAHPPRVPRGNVIDAPRKRVIEAQLTMLLDAGADRVAIYDALAPIGGNYITQNHDYQDQALDQVIEALGKLVRDLKEGKSDA